MAKPGPRPLPSNVKALRGTLRKDRMRPAEPKPRTQVPPCPSHLSPEAKKEWRRASKELAGQGLLTRLDKGALALYCQAWGRWVEAEENLKKFGTMVKSPSGFPMQSPYLAVANKAMEQMRQLLAEFGMSPSSRTRVRGEPPPATGGELAVLQEKQEFFRRRESEGPR